MVAAELARTVGSAAPRRCRPEVRRSRRAGRVGVDDGQRSVDRLVARVDQVDPPQADAVEAAGHGKRFLADRQVDLLLLDRRSAGRIALPADRDLGAGPVVGRVAEGRLAARRIVVVGAVADVVGRPTGAGPEADLENDRCAGVERRSRMRTGHRARGRRADPRHVRSGVDRCIAGQGQLVEHDRAVVGRAADIGDGDREVAAAVYGADVQRRRVSRP